MKSLAEAGIAVLKNTAISLDAAKITDSPIEADFLSALLSVGKGRCILVKDASIRSIHRVAVEDFERHNRVYLAPQVPVGPYRCDFLLMVYDVTPKFLCVECDGKDFHRATQEQRNRDNERDQWFRAKLIATKRFSGARIMRDPYKCAREAIRELVGGSWGDDGAPA
jgi:very-short-patch-repair endonuclease